MTRDALLLELEKTREELSRERARRAEHERQESELRAQVEALIEENRDLKARVDWFARRMFGKSSEKIDRAQLLLAFAAAQEEAARADALETAAGEESEETPRRRPVRRRPSRELPRRIVEVEPPEADRVCACCNAPKERIGAETSEQIDYVPATACVVETRRYKYACRRCQEGVAIAPLPPTAIERSIAGPGLVAHVVASKYADHLPLYRQEEILGRQGIDLPRSTLKDLVAQAAVRLDPVARAIRGSVLEGRVIHTDDTPVTYLLPGGGSATGYVWAYVGERDEVAYDFTGGRSRDGPLAFLGGYSGFLQADAYSGYDAAFAGGEITEVGCWAHARRHFVDARETDGKEAEPVIALIGRLYAIEEASKGLTEPERKLRRLERSRPILDAIRARVDAAAPAALPKGPLGKAIGYAQRNWTALTRYLDEGFLDIDNNAAERALRPVAVGRKNWLFAGSLEAGRRAAVLMSLVATCKLQGVDPFAYLRDVLVRIATTPPSEIGNLTPRRWKVAVENGTFTP